MFKKIALMLGLMTSMLFSLVARADVNTSDPYALVDQAAQQTFARLKADQAQVKSNPDHPASAARKRPRSGGSYGQGVGRAQPDPSAGRRTHLCRGQTTGI